MIVRLPPTWHNLEMPHRSPVPLIPHHPPDDLMLRIEMLRDEAEAGKQGTLAYLLDLALMEAQRISDQARRGEADRQADPRDLWRPD